MSRTEREILREVARGFGGRHLKKEYFDSFPGKRLTASQLMWAGLVEFCGPLESEVRLTPAGEHAMKGLQKSA